MRGPTTAELDRLLDPAPVAEEHACRDGYVAVRTPMRGVTGEMVDWWFDWHPRDGARYRLWHPGHADNRLDPPEHPRAKPHWGAVHHPVEDVGTGMERVRIAFVAPTQLGFSTDALDDPHVATIVCGTIAEDRFGLKHSVMAHVFLRDGEGLALRSRFWLGALVPGLVRRVAMPRDLPAALAQHCAEEYANLARILPGLYARNA
jgi:hypothetical protein